MQWSQSFILDNAIFDGPFEEIWWFEITEGKKYPPWDVKTFLMTWFALTASTIFHTAKKFADS